MTFIGRFFYFLVIVAVTFAIETHATELQIRSASQITQTDVENFARSAAWQKFFQVKRNAKSPIRSPYFFFDEKGAQDLSAELKAELQEYANPKSERKYGIQKIEAACAFPARKRLIEQGLSIQLPSPPCPDVKDWLDRLHANRASIVFAGPYSGNPASVLGHTFLRLYADEKIGARHDLLSYAVGFLANSTPGDSRALYMVKGLTGQYPGHFEIEPLYIKIGLYNNSESRDLWEQTLDLSAKEVEFLQLYIWELTFNASIPYYFVDENCSYRLLSLIEAVRPELNLISQLSPVVLPPDTVRTLISQKVADGTPRYRASVLRKIDMRVQNMNSDQKNNFRKMKTDRALVNNTEDIVVLESLMDYWAYRNYRAETNMNRNDNEMMELTFSRRSSLKFVSAPIEDSVVKKYFDLSPTYLGHRTSSVELRIGQDLSSESNNGEFRYRMGTHSLIDPPQGYDGVGQIEYLGFDVFESDRDGPTYWRALVVDAKAIEPIQAIDFKPSWSARVDALGQGSEGTVNFRGGFGLGFDMGLKSARAYLLPTLETRLALVKGSESKLYAGFEGGFYVQSNNLSLQLGADQLWTRTELENTATGEAAWHFLPNQDLKINVSNRQSQLGYKRFF